MATSRRRHHDEIIAGHELLYGVAHPLAVLADLQAERHAFHRFNGWLADHVVALVGSMVAAYLFAGFALIALPAAISSGSPLAMVNWTSSNFLQLVLLPILLVAGNREAERNRMKTETDHRAQKHLYQVNDEQLELLTSIAARLGLPPQRKRAG